MCCNQIVGSSVTKRFRNLVLDKEVNINQICSSGRTPFQLLFHQNWGNKLYRRLRALLQRRSVDVNVTEGEGWNRLMMACIHHKDVASLLDIITLLLDHGTDVNTIADDGRNALHILCCRPLSKGFVPNLFAIVNLLLQAGSNVDVTGMDGSNSLIALATNHYDHPDFLPILRLLIESGINVNSVSFKKQNILSILCYKYIGDKFVDIVRLLLDNSIKANLRDKFGLTAFQILVQIRRFAEDSEIVRLIRDC